MSAPQDNILARWSRRKLEAGRAGNVPPAGGCPEPRAARPGPPAGSEAPVQIFDPGDLPPIDSITATTDIRSFLRSGVPAALTRSALRRAWVTDPAIRDFIGVAESQWDYNDPAAMPGFGPLLTDQAAKLAENVVGRVDAAIGWTTDARPPLAQEEPGRERVPEQDNCASGGSDARR